jgi:helix-turn-helix protein
MKAIGDIIKEQNILLETLDPLTRGGFTQIPNFILKNPALSVGAKVAYAMFLSYAWHNGFCFPGQERLAGDMGISRPRVTQLIAELQQAGLITIQRRGQGKTNIYTVHSQVKGKGKRGRSNVQMLAGLPLEVSQSTTRG